MSTLLSNFANVFNYFYYGKNKISFTFKSAFISRVFLLLMLVILSPFDTPVEVIILALLFSNSILLFLSCSGLSNFLTRISFIIPSFSEIKLLIKETLPLWLASIFNILYGKVDIVILSIMLSYDSVAQYTIPYGLYKLSGIVFSVFLIPAFNLFSQYQNNTQENVKVFLNFFSIVIFTSIAFAVLMFFYGGSIINLLYGERYILAANIIPYFAMAVIGLGMNSLTGSFLNATGNYKIVMYSTMAGFIFNISANILLINLIGLMGAVYTAILTEAIVFLLQVFFIIRMNIDVIWKKK